MCTSAASKCCGRHVYRERLVDMDTTAHDDQLPSSTSGTAQVTRSCFLQRTGQVAGAVALSAVALEALSAIPLAAEAAKPKAGGGQLLGNIKGLGNNQALTYTDPASGDPALLIRLANGTVVSYDAVCTHAGCTVNYDTTRQMLSCPCHGALYDPAHGATVVGGPAPAPLGALAVRVDASGNVYALDGTATAANTATSSKSSTSTKANTSQLKKPQPNLNQGDDGGSRRTTRGGKSSKKGGSDDGGRSSGSNGNGSNGNGSNGGGGDD